MINNFFVLNRFVIEANKMLMGSVLAEAFSQDKDIIILKFLLNDDEHFLEISTNSSLPFINYKKEFKRAKKNTVSFFNNFLPAILKTISIAEIDRIIKFEFDKFSLYYFMRGKNSNVILIKDEKIIDSFKSLEKITSEQITNEILSRKFISHFTFPIYEHIDFQNWYDDIKIKYSFVGKDLLTELKLRIKNESEPIQELKILIEEIYNKNFSVFINNKTKELFFAPCSFTQFSYTEKKDYAFVLTASNYFLKEKYFYDKFRMLRKKSNDFIEREIKFLTDKIGKLIKRIEEGTREDEYKKIANLLLININSSMKNKDEIEVEDIYDNNVLVKIKLKRDLSIQQNADYYFAKSKNEKINFNNSKEFLCDTELKIKKLLSIKEKINLTKEIKEIEILMEELKIKMKYEQTDEPDIKSKFKHYVIEGKYHLYVGKDSKSNDLLTTKFAKQNDYWFHARGVSGSHCVLINDNVKVVIPKNIIKKASAITAYHSKAKTSGFAPVAYTFKKYVIKKKGMETGKVALLKEEVIIIKPEIPDGCEFVPN